MKNEVDRLGCSQGHRLKSGDMKERNAKIVGLFLEGVTAKALAVRFSLSESRIGDILEIALGKNPCMNYRASKKRGGRGRTAVDGLSGLI